MEEDATVGTVRREGTSCLINPMDEDATVGTVRREGGVQHLCLISMIEEGGEKERYEE
jgi:hypothetical protein